MIFISHNYNDKNIVEPVALALSKVFGESQIFYDSWTIQPGDGIIDKMNKGLADFTFFFFFVSRNSLQSKMVQLEWQNALLKASKNEVKFVPVKIDDCLMPSILMQTLYIDMTVNGFDIGLKQIFDVINKKSTFVPKFEQEFENLRAYYNIVGNKLIIEIRAESFIEPNPTFLIDLPGIKKDDKKFEFPSETSIFGGFHENVRMENRITSLEHVGIQRTMKKGFPFKCTIEFTKEFQFFGVWKEISKDEFKRLPIIKYPALT